MLESENKARMKFYWLIYMGNRVNAAVTKDIHRRWPGITSQPFQLNFFAHGMQGMVPWHNYTLAGYLSIARLTESTTLWRQIKIIKTGTYDANVMQYLYYNVFQKWVTERLPVGQNIMETVLSITRSIGSPRIIYIQVLKFICTHLRTGTRVFLLFAPLVFYTIRLCSLKIQHPKLRNWKFNFIQLCYFWFWSRNCFLGVLYVHLNAVDSRKQWSPQSVQRFQWTGIN